ncbi:MULTISPECIES: hypothetical protein [unclassified Streptomyces]|uniref:hypothetical protein n=1 Tax=unclassified Streptomyces TaxID=2593676 RepID=UPI00265C2CA4|nr:hypothetical protein [Streptomyces sp. DT2A-34]MDO0914483.1 hypothetical protein [Streptomyces sp. DT2A-34]
MKMVRGFGKAVAAIAIGGALAGASSTAFADAGEDVTSTLRAGGASDGAPWAYAYSLKSNGNKNVAVQDKFENGAAVYSEFDRKNTKGLRLWNTKDIYNSKTYSDSSATNYVVKVTACEQVNNAPDTCGPDDRPGDGR